MQMQYQSTFDFEQSKVYDRNTLYLRRPIAWVDKVKLNKFAEEKLYLLQKQMVPNYLNLANIERFNRGLHCF